MNTARAALLCGGLTAALAWTPLARAANPTDQAAAEALFNEAKQLVSAGDFEHACPKFAESQRLDPTVGTLLNIGNCYEKLDKLASAWGAFKEAEMVARNAGDAARQAEAARRAEALTPKLAKLAIVVPPAARVPGFEVRRDGSIVGEGQWGSALPADIGRHTIEASAPGRKPWSTTVRVDTDGSSASVDVPALEMAPSDTSAGGQHVPFWGGQRIAGVTMGGAGVIGLVVGALFGAQAISKNEESKHNCSPTDPNFCNDTGVAVRSDAQGAATASTVAIVVGGAALAGGIVLFAAAPSAKKEQRAWVELSPRFGGLMLHGSF